MIPDASDGRAGTSATGTTGETELTRGRELLAELQRSRSDCAERLVFTTHLPGRQAAYADWPNWVPEQVKAAFCQQGIRRPWTHQALAADLAAGGRHVILATAAASGKSLGYQLPVLSALVDDPRATALYLAPTKALGADQLRAITDLTSKNAELSGIRAASYDGDTPAETRRWIRAHARWVFTNPDMVHLGIVAGHRQWARLLRTLRYVVIDECHAYRGVFGAHVALVIKRLRRLARFYGADPTFVLASATNAHPAAAGSRLIDADCVALTEDGAPHGARTVAFWQPVGGGSAASEGARVMTDLVVAGARTLTFARSRREAESIARDTRERLAQDHPELVQRVAAYRAGYLREDRRRLESELASGALLGAASTNALELGVDITGLDAVVLAGFPGSVASFWQQAGRSGRSGSSGLVVVIADDNPLDNYLIHHPEAVLSRPLETAVFDPRNPQVLREQVLCAALELPLSEAEATQWGANGVLDELAAEGLARRRQIPSSARRSGVRRRAPLPQVERREAVSAVASQAEISQRATTSGDPIREHAEQHNSGKHESMLWHCTAATEPHASVDIRGNLGESVLIVENETGRLLGTSDTVRAPATLHQGAVYLHHGETFVVDELDLATGTALVRSDEPDWFTSVRQVTTIAVVDVRRSHDYGGIRTALAQVRVTRQVIGYLRTLPNGVVLDYVPLELPAQTLSTVAVSWSVTPSFLAIAGVRPAELRGALHAAEHAAIGLLPLLAGCDRSDTGGLATVDHPDTGLPTVFVYDGYLGGAGFSERGYERFPDWIATTSGTLADCPCSNGCPSCVQSPGCGSGNSPLHKTAAARLLRAIESEIIS